MKDFLTVLGIIAVIAILYWIIKNVNFNSANTTSYGSQRTADTTMSNNETQVVDVTTQSAPSQYTCTVYDVYGNKLIVNSQNNTPAFQRMCRGEIPYQYQQVLYYSPLWLGWRGRGHGHHGMH